MIGACKRAWRYYYVALALSWTVSYAILISLLPSLFPTYLTKLQAYPFVAHGGFRFGAHIRTKSENRLTGG